MRKLLSRINRFGLRRKILSSLRWFQQALHHQPLKRAVTNSMISNMSRWKTALRRKKTNNPTVLCPSILLEALSPKTSKVVPMKAKLTTPIQSQVISKSRKSFYRVNKTELGQNQASWTISATTIKWNLTGRMMHRLTQVVLKITRFPIWRNKGYKIIS